MFRGFFKHESFQPHTKSTNDFISSALRLINVLTVFSFPPPTKPLNRLNFVITAPIKKPKKRCSLGSPISQQVYMNTLLEPPSRFFAIPALARLLPTLRYNLSHPRRIAVALCITGSLAHCLPPKKMPRLSVHDARAVATRSSVSHFAHEVD